MFKDLTKESGVKITPGVGPIIQVAFAEVDLRKVPEGMVERVMTHPSTLGAINTEERKKARKDAADKAAKDKKEGKTENKPAALAADDAAKAKGAGK